MHIPNGVYPVMITPFTAQNQVDYEAVDRIVDFYAEHGCRGVFAVCQSSEMFFLTEDERANLASRVVKASAGRLCVVASGHVSPRAEDQLRELKRVRDSGVDAVVMISCRLAEKDEDDDALLRNMDKILNAMPDTAFGMYECPHPYKRLLTPRVLRAMADSGRFSFIKDTCCDADVIRARIELLGGRIGLFNANCATFYETLLAGANGFSGIMANYHPEFFAWLMNNYRAQPEKARALAAMLSVMSCAEGCCHPVAAKYHMNLAGVPMQLSSRSADVRNFNPLMRHTIDDIFAEEAALRDWLNA